MSTTVFVSFTLSLSLTFRLLLLPANILYWQGKRERERERERERRCLALTIELLAALLNTTEELFIFYDSFPDSGKGALGLMRYHSKRFSTSSVDRKHSKAMKKKTFFCVVCVHVRLRNRYPRRGNRSHSIKFNISFFHFFSRVVILYAYICS